MPAIVCCSPSRTTASASIRKRCAASVCSAWRSAYAVWAANWRLTRSSAWGRPFGPSFRSPISGPSRSMPIRILLADDHTIVRDGLRALLERQPDMSVVAEAGDGRECVQMTAEHSPDVVMMDVAMPGMNGIEAARRILLANPKTAVLMLSMHQDESYVLRSLKA